MNLILLPDTHPILRQVAEPVTEFNDELLALCEEMHAIMRFNKGIGLAAPQVGISKRIIVVDVSGPYIKDQFLINPEIEQQSGEQSRKEGCLTFPDLFLEVTRAKNVIVKYQDVKGNPNIMTADKLNAVVLQHEIDHLNGKLFIDYVKPMTLLLARKKLALR
ncbi:MAG: peptide deformylase [Candidatus Thorarchaeota archaeon]|nr:MAG: peptide deformylase [Candidatus Thorarchaeota archaeon]